MVAMAEVEAVVNLGDTGDAGTSDLPPTSNAPPTEEEEPQGVDGGEELSALVMAEKMPES